MAQKDAEREAARLREEITRHNRLYYVEAMPEIGDKAYDRLVKRLEAIEAELPEDAALTADAGYFSEENVRITARHGLDAPIQRQLAHHAPALHPVALGNLARGGQQRQRDGQLIMASLLAGARGRQIDRDAAVGHRIAGVAQGRGNALTSLTHGVIGHAHGREVGQAIGEVELDEDGIALDAPQPHGVHARETHSSLRPGISTASRPSAASTESKVREGSFRRRRAARSSIFIPLIKTRKITLSSSPRQTPR